MDTNKNSGAWHWTGGAEPQDLAWRGPVQQATEALGMHDVLVANEAIGLNPVDWKFIAWGAAPWQPGQIPGVDGVGRVVAVGQGVARDWLGQRVGYHQSLARAGSFASRTVVAARALMRVPPGLPSEVAVAAICPLLTALQAIGKLPAMRGAPVLVTGAGGGVGHWLVQLGAAAGWQVHALAHERHHARLAALGATACEAAREALPQRTFAAALDSVSGTHAALLAPCLRANGHLLCVQDRLEAPPTAAFGPALSLHEVALNALHDWGSDAQWRELASVGERAWADLRDGRLQAQEVESWPLQKLPQALTALKHHLSTARPVVRVSCEEEHE